MRAATCTAPCRAVSEPTQFVDACLCTAQCHRTRSVKLARTIGDLAGSGEIESAHLAEALHLRSSEVDAGIVSMSSAYGDGRGPVTHDFKFSPTQLMPRWIIGLVRKKPFLQFGNGFLLFIVLLSVQY